jgi:RNA polymerase sigma-70 factor (ECF subfamily)
VLPLDYGPPADPHDPSGEPVVESVWIEPYPDEQLRYEQRESVELAFVAALQHLPPRQRAVLILRDVLGFTAREVAEVLDATPASIDSALQRAHKTVDERLPERTQQATLGSLDDEDLRQIVDSYTTAWERADVDALVAMLSEDAIFSMPPQREWYSGRGAVATFLRAWPLARPNRWRVVPTSANGQLAFAHYGWDEDTGTFVAHAIDVLTLEGSRIKEIVAFRTPELLGRFGLPEVLAE